MGSSAAQALAITAPCVSVRAMAVFLHSRGGLCVQTARQATTAATARWRALGCAGAWTPAVDMGGVAMASTARGYAVAIHSTTAITAGCGATLLASQTVVRAPLRVYVCALTVAREGSVQSAQPVSSRRTAVVYVSVYTVYVATGRVGLGCVRALRGTLGSFAIVFAPPSFRAACAVDMVCACKAACAPARVGGEDSHVLSARRQRQQAPLWRMAAQPIALYVLQLQDVPQRAPHAPLVVGCRMVSVTQGDAFVLQAVVAHRAISPALHVPSVRCRPSTARSVSCSAMAPFVARWVSRRPAAGMGNASTGRQATAVVYVVQGTLCQRVPSHALSIATAPSAAGAVYVTQGVFVIAQWGG